jgi:hypothetical protein
MGFGIIGLGRSLRSLSVVENSLWLRRVRL